MLVSVKTLRNVLVLFFSNTAPSLVSLCALPVLTRLFQPDAVGQWAIFQSLLFIPGVLSTLRYELAVVVEKEDKDADVVTALALIMAVLSCLAAGAVVLVCAGFSLIPIAGFGLLSLSCLAASFGLVGLINLGSAICIREAAFGTVLRARVFQAVMGVLPPIALSYWSRSSNVLIFGSTFGLLTGAIFFSPAVYGNIVHFLADGNRRKRLGVSLIKNRAFAHFGLPYTVITQAFGLSLTSLLAVSHGTFVLGQYSLMNRALTAPAGVVINSFGQLTARPLAQYAEKRTAAAKPIFDLVLILLAVSLPLATIATIYGEEIFIFIFGTTWSMAGRFAEWAAIPMCLKLSVGWIDRLFDSWREQRFGFFVGSIGCAVWLAAFVVAELISASPYVAVAGWCIGLALSATVWGGAMIKLVGRPPLIVLPFLLVTVVGVVPIMLVHAVSSAAGSAYTDSATAAVTFAVFGTMLFLLRSFRCDLSLLMNERSGGRR